MKMHRPIPCAVQEKFRPARRGPSSALIERDDEIDAVLTAGQVSPIPWQRTVIGGRAVSARR